MKALVIGAVGFIGSHLVDSCLANGMDVVAMVHEKVSNPDHVKHKIRTVKADVSDKTFVKKLIDGERPNYIFHMAVQSFVVLS